jgi:uncharacterized protein involved in exopolysaccharide biosynthesis
MARVSFSERRGHRLTRARFWSVHPPFAAEEVTNLEDLSLRDVGRLVLRRRTVVLGGGLAVALLVVLLTVFQGRSYSSTSLFMPQTSSDNSLLRLSGLAAEFGFALPTQDPGSSPAFYADLLESRDVLREVVLTQFAAEDGRNEALVDIYRAKGSSPAARRDAAVRKLRDHIHVRINHETDVVTLQVTTPWPSLSQKVAARLIDLVSQFNLRTRQTRAGAERRFVEGRLAEAKDSLEEAERRLQSFLQRNREYRNAPPLAFEHDRLDRQVNMQQQLYTTLAQGYEQARIDEVRNTPVITVIELPDYPTRPDSRYLLLKGALALIAGLLFGTLVIATRHAFGGLPPAETSVDFASGAREPFGMAPRGSTPGERESATG